MGKIEGSASAEIDASIERCYQEAADIERITEWQGGMRKVDVLERDGEARPLVAQFTNETNVRNIVTTVRFSYDPPHGLTWKQTRGDLKALDGRWAFAPSPRGGTKATYSLVGDPGRVLGMFVRGPVEERIRELLITNRPGELKKRLQAG